MDNQNQALTDACNELKRSEHEICILWHEEGEQRKKFYKNSSEYKLDSYYTQLVDKGICPAVLAKDGNEVIEMDTSEKFANELIDNILNSK